MSEPRATIGQAFPHTDVVARFVVAMCMAGNDVKHATLEAGRANSADAPEFSYHVRVAIGHAYEGIVALQEWRQDPAVRKFLATLPKVAQAELKKASGLMQQIGKGVAEHTRNRTFHYPYPSASYPVADQELQDILNALGGDEVKLTMRGGEPLSYRFEFADKAALMLALSKFDDDEARLTGQVERARDASVAFAKFAGHVFAAYCDQRGLRIGDPEAADGATT